MASAYNELVSSSPEELRRLINHYRVPLIEGSSPLQSILIWLQPVSQEFPALSKTQEILQAIQEGRPFDPSVASETDLLDVLFGDKIRVNVEIVEDFANFPIQTAWGHPPWDLLQGYLNSGDREEYFESVTNASSKDFLNETERIFYLTRGYGRPNKEVSSTDMQRREQIARSSPTALIVLSDLLGVCPGLQDPTLILEQLSSADLSSIDKYYYRLMDSVTKCTGSKILCENSGATQSAATCPGQCSDIRQFYGLSNCDPVSLQCFQEVLRSVGALDTVEWDPTHNVFVSNLSQAGLYRDVVLDKKWSLNDVRNLPDPYVTSVLRRLPDSELLRIQNHGMKFADTLQLDRLQSRLRENLLNAAAAFLTHPRFFFNDGEVRWGRLVDDELDQYPLEELIENVKETGALIDSRGHSMTVEEAESLADDRLSDAVYKTRALQINNLEYIAGLLPSERQIIADIFESQLREGVRMDRLQEIFPVQALPLGLWSRRGRWVPVGMTFEEYFRLHTPNYRQLVEDSLEYYRQSL